MKRLLFAFFLVLSPLTAHSADVKISALPAASALAGTEVAPVVQSSTTKKATIDQIKTYVSASPTLVTPALGVATATSLSAASIVATGPIKRQGYTVATLPGSPGTGAMAYVTDAVACTFLASITGGSSTFCPVIYNGSGWVGE